MKPILKDTRAFRDWITNQRGARGPAPDKDKAVKLYLAIETVRAVRSKKGLSEACATPREVAKVLEFLDGEAPSFRDKKSLATASSPIFAWSSLTIVSSTAGSFRRPRSKMSDAPSTSAFFHWLIIVG